MMGHDGTLLAILRRKTCSNVGFGDALRGAGSELGLAESQLLSPVNAAYALLRLNLQVEEVSRLLTWQEFEKLAASLIRAAGFQVRDNVVLTRPRAQIDVVAYGTSSILSVDCKHYRREQAPSSIAKFARAQVRRSALLRLKTDDPRPIASVILTTSEPEGKFVEGAAVVPIRTLRSFLTTLDSYGALLDLR